ncbi:hypothetical protein TNCV_4377271 [Trichonephila clavipes]|nr:hypothetical protein TNCV_4377271 [Trichonephila clavipes]
MTGTSPYTSQLRLMSCGIVSKLHGHLYLYISSNLCSTQFPGVEVLLLPPEMVVLSIDFSGYMHPDFLKRSNGVSVKIFDNFIAVLSPHVDRGEDLAHFLEFRRNLKAAYVEKPLNQAGNDKTQVVIIIYFKLRNQWIRLRDRQARQVKRNE